MSEKGRLLAQDEWKHTLAEILQAQNRRSIPRAEPDKMPPEIQPSAYQSGLPAMLSLFLMSDATTLHNESTCLWPPAMACTTADGSDGE